MGTNKKTVSRTTRSADEWRALLTRFAASGMSLRTFCRTEKLSESAFYRRRALLVEGDKAPATRRAASFVDLGALGAPTTSGPRMELNIDLGGGMMLTLVRS